MPQQLRLITLGIKFSSIPRSYNPFTKLTNRTFRRKNNDKNFSYVGDRNHPRQMGGGWFKLSSTHFMQ